jgi:1-pyrroline-5-carboxylate dehydrogenase
MRAGRIELPLFIGGNEVRTGKLESAVEPHDHASVLANAHMAGTAEVGEAIASLKRAWHDWSRTDPPRDYRYPFMQS